MTDDTIPLTIPPLKRGPGRPRKVVVEREPMRAEVPAARWKMRATPNWETMDAEGEGTPDRFHIPKAMIPEGMSAQWVTTTVYGQDFTNHRTKFERHGWTPVHQDDFDGRFDGMFMPKGRPGEITLDGLVLMMRPEEITERARLRDNIAAREAVSIKEQALRGGDVGTSLDSRHPSALNANRISKTIERITIPED